MTESGLALEGVRLVAAPFTDTKPEGWVRFACFSDTHGLHGQIAQEHLPQVDVLLHAGDFTNTGETEQISSFADWLRSYPATHKVVIAGNHDVTFEPAYYERAWGRFHFEPYDCNKARSALVDGSCCIYLEDSSAEVMGYRIYGSPYQPAFCDWAFNLEPGAACGEAWARIPADVDILMTHGPARGMGDLCSHGARAGCQDLLEAIRRRAVPVAVAGHIHEGYGVTGEGATVYINASTCTSGYRPTNPPIVFDAPPAPQLRAAASRLQALGGSPDTRLDMALRRAIVRALTHTPLKTPDGEEIVVNDVDITGEAFFHGCHGKLRPIFEYGIVASTRVPLKNGEHAVGKFEVPEFTNSYGEVSEDLEVLLQATTAAACNQLTLIPKVVRNALVTCLPHLHHSDLVHGMPLDG